jgi:hypothetical protein
MRERVSLVKASYSAISLDRCDDPHAMLMEAIDETFSEIGSPDSADIERVARALCQSDGFDPDELITVHRSYAEPRSAPRWENYEEYARVAVTAFFSAPSI